MTLNQLIGYRTMIVNTGDYGAGTMQPIDFTLFDQWLGSSLCNSNANRQVFMLDGDKTGEVLSNFMEGDALMRNRLGAGLICDSFNGRSNDIDCAPEEPAYCVRVVPSAAAVYGTDRDVDAFGNGCPNRFGFNVLSTYGTGVGNRRYVADGGGGKQADFAQIVNENLASDGNYRTILNGVSAHHLTARTTGPDPCPRDLPSVVSAIISEWGAALRWGFGVPDNASIPRLTRAVDLAACEGTWNPSSEVEDANAGPFVSRLNANAPNPFNPRTVIRYSLAQAGPVEIAIFDVNGRRVRQLVESGRMSAGPHEAVWDGANDRGNRVGSGIYWTQMRAGDYVSTRKMVVLK
jgi:hypothetical protein